MSIKFEVGVVLKERTLIETVETGSMELGVIFKLTADFSRKTSTSSSDPTASVSSRGRLP